MAFINTQDVKRIRDTLKVAFPDFRFSVRKTSGGMAVTVTVLSGPSDFSDICRYDSEQIDINHHHTYQYGEHQAFFDAVIAVIKMAPERKWWDESDSRVDYFNTAFYYYITVGMWGRPYQVREPRKASQNAQCSYMDQVRTALALSELAA